MRLRYFALSSPIDHVSILHLQPGALSALRKPRSRSSLTGITRSQRSVLLSEGLSLLLLPYVERHVRVRSGTHFLWQ